MDVKTAIKNSIEHWERMIQWASEQPAKSSVSLWQMKQGMGEHWGSEFCELCKIYSSMQEFNGTFEFSCGECPLREQHGECSVSDPRGINTNHWIATSQSETWSEWVDNARIFLNQLRGLEIK